MNSLSTGHGRKIRRRVRVVVRPKERARRARVLAAVAAVGALGAIAFVTVKHIASDFRFPLPSVQHPDAALVSGPEPLRSLAQAVADASAGSAGEKAEALKSRFACLADVRVRRLWTEKTATLTLVSRRPVAAAARRGRAAGFLGDDGTVFDAPSGTFVLSGPAVDVAGASSAELSALAREWPVLSAVGAFPSQLLEMSFRSLEDGWEARLVDGTRVLWGRLEWTREKLARLSEAVADARTKEPGAFSADLRWFEDGKVLLTQLQKKPAERRP